MAITYTKAGLAALIADDLQRGDLTTQIDNAIDHAISERMEERFFFNETLDTTFDTVADQTTYSSDDDANIPKFYELDEVYLEDDDGNRLPLDRVDGAEIEFLLQTSAPTGQPTTYAWFDEQFIFYPIPDTVYTIIPVGHIEVDAPADENDTTNPWVTKRGAFQLIRADAKAYLYVHVIRDANQASLMVDAAQGALAKLRSRTSRKKASGTLVPTAF